jgi:hypothetical protein
MMYGILNGYAIQRQEDDLLDELYFDLQNEEHERAKE